MVYRGKTGTIPAFITEIRSQDPVGIPTGSHSNWDTNFLAEAINSWIRAGFDLEEIGISSDVLNFSDGSIASLEEGEVEWELVLGGNLSFMN
jgi:hypothetical protein